MDRSLPVVLEEVAIEEATTRPMMMPLVHIPLKLGCLVLAVGAMLFVMIGSTYYEIVDVAVTAFVCFAVRPFVASDYQGFDILVAWVRFDFRCLDSRIWGGTRPAPFPLRVARYYGMTDV